MYQTRIYARDQKSQIPSLYSKGNAWTGLNNQIFAFVNSIKKCHKDKISYLSCEPFITDIRDGTYVPLSEIIDYEQTELEIERNFKFKIKFLDQHKSNLFVKNAEYGFGDKKINVTDKIQTSVVGGNHNKLFGDPCFGVKKKLYITLSDGERDFHHELDENAKFLLPSNAEVIGFNISAQGPGNPTFSSWFTCIRYSPKFFEIANILQPTNVKCAVHFRCENDWINASMIWHRTDRETTIREIVDQYKPHIEKHSELLIQTAEIDSVQHLNIKNFQYLHLEKDEKDKILIEKFGYTGREMRAIIDFIIAVYNADFFIGYANTLNTNGSTYSMAVCYCRKKLNKPYIGLHRNHKPDIYTGV